MSVPLHIPWVSASILQPPLKAGSRLHRGALILNYVDEVLALLPEIRRFFFVIERRGWHGLNRSVLADIKLVEDTAMLAATARAFPRSILLPIGPADFIDHRSFRPLETTAEFDVIQISCWSPRKRIELLIQAAAQLPDLRFVHLGHFEYLGTEQEREYRARCLALARRIAPNIAFPFADRIANDQLPTQKEAINEWLNRARVGVLTAKPEGINRFKMECLAANRPVLVASDAGPTTQKHINALTGSIFEPTPEKLAAAIVGTLKKYSEFTPRKYLLETTGNDRSLTMLKSALRQLCARTRSDYRFDDIAWDGRNDSLVWGDAALALIARAIKNQ